MNDHRHTCRQDAIESDLIQERYERFIRFLKAEGQTRSECRLLIYVVETLGWCMNEIERMAGERSRATMKGTAWWVWLAREWREGIGADWSEFPNYLEDDQKEGGAG